MQTCGITVGNCLHTPHLSQAAEEGAAGGPTITVAPGSVLLVSIPVKNFYPLQNLQISPLNLKSFYT